MVFVFAVLGFVCLSFVKTPRIITGKITDNNNNNVTGATIVIKGTRLGTLSGSDGKYSITITNDNAVLVISAVGFITQEVSVGTNNVVNVTLAPQTASLNDVVVIGYGSRSERKISGSVSTVTQGYVSPGLTSNKRAFDWKDNNADGVYDKFDSLRYNPNFNTAGYDEIIENPFLKVSDNPLSTFSIDVDAASYSNVRRFINDGALPPPGAVRIEEMINYFSYTYPQPQGNDPFSVNTEIAACPWNSSHRLALVGLQGRRIAYESLPASNLVFLIDVSGSMDEPDKLPLVKESLNLLVDQLREQDKVSLVVYAGNAGLVLPATSGGNKIKIKEAIANLEAGGSTAGGAGIQLAYTIAQQNFVKGGNNRVILCTDGDFNVGASSDDALANMIEKERETGVYLTVLGYGNDNYQDAKMQKLADKGNGNHSFIDDISEAKKVLINEFGGTLFTIAKDVKLQVEFNPQKVQGYRLIGYENRMLAKEDFNNDKKDAGDLGSGHTVTALYENIPAGINDRGLDSVDALRYQRATAIKVNRAYSGELMNIKLRYKQPGGDVSSLMQHPVEDGQIDIAKTSNNFRFAAAVAEFGMLLRNSKYKGNGDYSLVHTLAQNATGDDIEGYRKQFLQLVTSASILAGQAGIKKKNEDVLAGR
jgi:Ca-activated chloride channel family protein